MQVFAKILSLYKFGVEIFNSEKLINEYVISVGIKISYQGFQVSKLCPNVIEYNQWRKLRLDSLGALSKFQ